MLYWLSSGAVAGRGRGFGEISTLLCEGSGDADPTIRIPEKAFGFPGIQHLSYEKNPYYFPLNPGWFIGILILAY